jgi:hypothetical protein
LGLFAGHVFVLIHARLPVARALVGLTPLVAHLVAIGLAALALILLTAILLALPGLATILLLAAAAIALLAGTLIALIALVLLVAALRHLSLLEVDYTVDAATPEQATS